MATIGTLKGTRTRAKNTMGRAIEGVGAILEDRQNLRGMTRDQLDDLLHATASKILDVRMKMERLETANDKLSDAYANDEVLLTQFQELLDDESNSMDQTAEAIHDMEALKQMIECKLAQVARPAARVEAVPGGFEDNVTQILARLQVAQERQEAVAHGENDDGVNAHVPAAPVTIKLPKMEIQKFDGDIKKWTGFWAQFDSAVHRKENLAIVDKFNYLKAYLIGEALQTISGLQLTAANYVIAIDLLRERFGKEQLIIDAHYNELNNMYVTSGNTAKLRTFCDMMESNLRSLTAMGENIENRQMVNLIKSKMSTDIMAIFERKKEPDVVWTVALLRQYLRTDLTVRESLDQSRQNNVGTTSQNGFKAQESKSTYKPWSDSKYKTMHKSSTESFFAGEGAASSGHERAPTRPCMFCEQMHWSADCNVCTTLESRRQKLQGKCFNCLQPGHMTRDCRRKQLCYYCKKRGHHQVLCFKKCSTRPFKASEPPKRKFEKPSTEVKPKSEMSAMTVETKEPGGESGLLAAEQSVVMRTALIVASNPLDTEETTTRLLMDCGSQRTWMAECLAKRLKLKLGVPNEIPLNTFGSEEPQRILSPPAQVKLKLKNGATKEITVNVVPRVTGIIQRMPVTTTNMSNDILDEFVLADTRPTEAEWSTIELLIGNDYYEELVLPQRVEIQPGLYVVASKFGWLLSGRVDCSNGDKRSVEQQMLILNNDNDLHPESMLFTNTDKSLSVEPNMEEFWALETIGIKGPTQEIDDKIAFQQFLETVQIKDKRFEVGWPWKEANPELSENYSLAYNRFKSVARQLERNPQLLVKYDKVIQEQVKLGIVEKVTSETKEGTIKHYVPHHPVVTEDKATTKLRIVYDASAKTKKCNKSLNECLYRGPVLLQDLCGLLLRFRLHHVALMADIEKAFLNIGLRVDDRDVTRFFWFKDPQNPTVDGNVQIYRFCRIPFGVISSPFLLAGTINYLMDMIGSPVAKQIKEDIYVDNVTTGTESVSAATKLYHESQEIFKCVSLNLREWASNSEEFLSQIPPVHRAEGTVFKVLGVTWDTKDDCLQIMGSSKAEYALATTKREVLKALASVYDPLGFFTPVTLKAKLFLHSLWKAQMDWDTTIPDDKLSEWHEIATQLKAIALYKIPRLIADMSNDEVEFRLLCFCDASADGYATAVYLHMSCNGSNQAHLVFSKTRLSPQQKLSIPRLELMAVLIGVRSLMFVQEQLRLPVMSKVLWSDSQCVLHWIRSTKRLSVFVENRVSKIREEHDVSFRYVHTSENPADLATRGKSVEELNESIWWHGPVWLQNNENEWPTGDVSIIDQAVLQEVESEIKEQKVLFEIGLPVGEGPAEKMITPFMIEHVKFSSLCKLLRVTAWCLRYVHKLRSRCQLNGRNLTVKSIIPFPVQEIGCLTIEEIAKAKLLWELAVQKRWFPSVIQAIMDSKRHNLSDQLNLRCDKDGLLRCHGRFGNADLTEGAREPKLLSKNDHFTVLVINDVHERTIHSGVSQTLATVRHEYWVLQGRSKVRLVLKECRVCRRIAGGPYQLPKMAPWPNLRVSRSTPFTHTGLDYFGPMYVRTSPDSPVKKVWICLFTCTVVRAVHLEIVDDMTTEQFLMCLRRFIARFGKPSVIISDNASQFKLANDTLAKIWAKVRHDPETLDYVAQQGIKWKFIVELAPWMGGFYERMVGLVKTSLKKAIGKLCLFPTMLQTVLCEVEAVVNSRPLVYVGDDVNSTLTLTPAHFLSQNPQTGVPVMNTEGMTNDPDYQAQLSSSERLLATWKKGQEHLNRFWDIWSNEYLLSLRERAQHHVKAGRIQSTYSVQVGDVVLIKESMPRGVWKMGKIKELITSQDGQIRTAKVLLASHKVLNRRINLLCPIECPANEQHASAQPVIDTVQGNDETNDDDNVVHTVETKRRPKRAAFLQAQQRIQQMTKE